MYVCVWAFFLEHVSFYLFSLSFEPLIRTHFPQWVKVGFDLLLAKVLVAVRPVIMITLYNDATLCFRIVVGIRNDIDCRMTLQQVS